MSKRSTNFDDPICMPNDLIFLNTSRSLALYALEGQCPCFLSQQRALSSFVNQNLGHYFMHSKNKPPHNYQDKAFDVCFGWPGSISEKLFSRDRDSSQFPRTPFSCLHHVCFLLLKFPASFTGQLPVSAANGGGEISGHKAVFQQMLRQMFSDF